MLHDGQLFVETGSEGVEFTVINNGVEQVLGSTVARLGSGEEVAVGGVLNSSCWSSSSESSLS